MLEDPASVIYERIYRFVNERSGVVYLLFSGGVDSGVVLAVSSGLPVRALSRLVVVYIELVGNTHRLNVEAARSVYKSLFNDNIVTVEGPPFRLSFISGSDKPMMIHFRSYPRLIDWGDQVRTYGWPSNRINRWCHNYVKGEVFRSLPPSNYSISYSITGLDNDSRFRASRVELLSRFRFGGRIFEQLNPLVGISKPYRWLVAQKYSELDPIIRLYRRFGDSLNCVLCPIRQWRKQRTIIERLDDGMVYSLCGAVCDAARKGKAVAKSLQRACECDASDTPLYVWGGGRLRR